MRLGLKGAGLCFFSVALLAVLLGSVILSGAAASQCTGSIAQCHDEDESFMESETATRLLAGMKGRYLGYGAVLGPNKAASFHPKPGRPYTKPRCSDPYLRAC